MGTDMKKLLLMAILATPCIAGANGFIKSAIEHSDVSRLRDILNWEFSFDKKQKADYLQLAQERVTRARLALASKRFDRSDALHLARGLGSFIFSLGCLSAGINELLDPNKPDTGSAKTTIEHNRDRSLGALAVLGGIALAYNFFDHARKAITRYDRNSQLNAALAVYTELERVSEAK
jgi:hypothetical protein